MKKFALLPETWEAVRTNGTEAELTPTLKLKRRIILKKHKKVIAAMYEVSV
jgi:long-chain acyl-CoA synthetase